MNQINTPDLNFDIDAELAKFEAEERRRLGLPPSDGPATGQWHDAVNREFTRAQREHTTILFGGLTIAQDILAQSALRGLGYNMKALDVPDTAALQVGREYGNRGQCNPTYFTVGNLVKHLQELRDKQGLSVQEIVDNYLFLTAGACGPCRFGTYVTEYRKALRDAGFDGFRVMLFQQQGGLKQATGEEAGLEMSPKFFIAMLKALILGDVLNALMYRIRPYEVEKGATDRAVDQCKTILCEAFESRTSLMVAIARCRKLLAAIEVDRTVAKPKVSIIGEFWAMTTEGDGNYRLQHFLESEGAECDVQLLTAWLLYNVWQVRYDTKNRAVLRGADKTGIENLDGVDVRKRLLLLAVAEKVLRTSFQVFAHGLGLYDYHLPDMEEIADVSHAFYDNNLRGGEGHMEVGKLILNIAKSKVNMTLSVKPFGCMPSSSVSDGVQSLITEMNPDGIFLPIETSGDGAVNVYSRIQMQLFKAKQLAAREVERELERAGLTMDEVRGIVAERRRLSHAFHKSPHVAGCTAADLVAEVGRSQDRLGNVKRRISALVSARKQRADERQSLVEIARQAAAKSRARSSVARAVVPAEPNPVSVDMPMPAAMHTAQAPTKLRVLN